MQVKPDLKGINEPILTPALGPTVTSEISPWGLSQAAGVSYVVVFLGLSPERPARPSFAEIKLLVWLEAGIDIPWPEGKTPRKAIIEWARQQTEWPP